MQPGGLSRNIERSKIRLALIGLRMAFGSWLPNFVSWVLLLIFIHPKIGDRWGKPASHKKCFCSLL
jgi:hypothetical protein